MNKQEAKDTVWLASMLLHLMEKIREKELLDEFAGEDHSAFDYVESEAKKLYRLYRDEKDELERTASNFSKTKR